MRRTKRCARCGIEFPCGADSESERCWCDSLPPIVPMSEEGCLCEGCLKVEVEALKAQRAADNVGLCAGCRNARRLRTKTDAVIYLCEAAATDRRLPKYPRLPMLSCPAYAPQA